MSGYGLIAVLLIRLDARRGQWVNVADLARHINADPQDVRTTLEGLMLDGVTLHRQDGVITQAGVFGAEPPPEAAPCA